MGSLVEYRCKACGFSSGKLAVGWGKAGRASYWGGLARCDACKALSVVDLAGPRRERREHRCGQCNGPLALLDGIAEGVPCPGCGVTLGCASLGSWD